MENGTNRETRTVLDELYERRRELWAKQSEIRAQVHEIEEQIARTEEDVTGAEWHRLSVIAERSGKPEDNEAAHRAFIHDMAVRYVRRGARPDMGSHCQAEIDEAIDAMTRSVQ